MIPYNLNLYLCDGFYRFAVLLDPIIVGMKEWCKEQFGAGFVIFGHSIIFKQKDHRDWFLLRWNR